MLDYLHWDVFKVNTFAVLLLAVSITLLPLIRNVYQLFMFSALNGFGAGVQALCIVTVTPLLCRPEDSKQATMFLFTIISIPGGVGASIAGKIITPTKERVGSTSSAGVSCSVPYNEARAKYDKLSWNAC